MKSNPLALGLILSALAGFSGLAHAQTAEELGVAKRSSFDTSAVQRDPLTPIGWKKPVAATPVVANGAGVKQEPVVRPESFVVSSISLDRIPLAVINGKPYGEGDLILWAEGNRKIQGQVLTIRDGVVTLQFQDITVKCLIRTWQKPATGKAGAAGR